MQVAVPIEWFVGEVEGVLVAEVSLRYHRDAISNPSRRERLRLCVSHDGDLIAHPGHLLGLAETRYPRAYTS